MMGAGLTGWLPRNNFVASQSSIGDVSNLVQVVILTLHYTDTKYTELTFVVLRLSKSTLTFQSELFYVCGVFYQV